MKYKTCKLVNGKFAVLAGKDKHYISSVRDTLEEAQECALIYSIQWYHEQMESAYIKLSKHMPDKYSDIFEGQSHGKCSLGDLLA